MANNKQHLVRIHDDAHCELKIISAITRRPMGDLIEEMVIGYKNELTGGNEWGKDAFDLISERERAIKHAKGSTMRRKEKAEYKRQIIRVISRMRDEGLTFDEIASRLRTDGYQTLTGRGGWQAGTVNRLYKKHQENSNLKTALELLKKDTP